ncbi:SDR family oxidoreductase [Dinghuibacter silviterrae]|uniref:Nucleoside-diphosphate-sugar epimerase n=1 Tax=Dinghuibacter silviterrae TaxID=1539049 RepID=A0A4R8DI83_9BACT|nr:SDR family oxidoreductase [Dinghuibacter silviterrae]TDW97449.1 nucleoside-diphosphate-sugar epimerase [Dinghuibacter silviterrae]
MRVFVTGASGFIGSAVVKNLLAAGHQVLGMARSDASAQTLTDMGIQVHRGDVHDLESLRKGAALADGVIHLAFVHDFTTYVENCETDRKAIEAMGAVLAGTGHPLLVTSGTGAPVTPGQLRGENEPPAPSKVQPRMATEEAAFAVSRLGVPVSVVRLPPSVHARDRHGLVSQLFNLARQKGFSAYIGDGLNRWPAVHRLDAARVFHLALEKGSPLFRYHAVGEEGITLKDIAEAVGRRLNVPVTSLSPEEAVSHFTWMSSFVGANIPASSALTQEHLGWHPENQASLLEDIAQAILPPSVA